MRKLTRVIRSGMLRVSMRCDWTAPAAMTAVVDDEAIIVVDMAPTPDLSVDEGAESGAFGKRGLRPRHSRHRGRGRSLRPRNRAASTDRAVSAPRISWNVIVVVVAPSAGDRLGG